MVLGPMSAEQVRRAVVEPARLARTEVAAAWSRCCSPTWRRGHATASGRRTSRARCRCCRTRCSPPGSTAGAAPLTVADYLASGGIKDALTQSAERAYESLTPGQQRLARRLLLRLVHVADDLPPSRASVPLGELLSGIGAAATRGRRDGNGSGDATRDAGARRLHRRADDHRGHRHRAADPRRAARPPGPGCGAGSRRAPRSCGSGGGSPRARRPGRRPAGRRRRCGAAASSRSPGTGPRTRTKRAALLPLAVAFVAASVAAGTARERLERRRTTRLRSIVAVLTVLVLAVAGLTAYAFSAAAGGRHRRGDRDQGRGRRDRRTRPGRFARGRVRRRPAPRPGPVGGGAARVPPGTGSPQTPQATASLLDSAGTSSAARILDSAGPVQWVVAQPGPPAAGRGGGGWHAAAVERRRAGAPGAGRHAGARRQARTRCTRRRSARTGG